MLKIFCNITILMMAVVACAPKPEVKYIPNERTTQPDYSPRNADRQLLKAAYRDFNIQEVLGITEAQESQRPWLKNSAEIFQVAEKTLILGDQYSSQSGEMEQGYRVQFKKFGHDLINLFYSQTENASQMDVQNTMYLPAALGFEGEKIFSMLQKIGNPENVAIADKIFNHACKSDSLLNIPIFEQSRRMSSNLNYVEACHSVIWPNEIPVLQPIEFIRSIKDYLSRTGNLLEEKKATPEFVKKFRAQVERDYMLALNKAEVDLVSTNEKEKLIVNSKVIVDVINYLTFIPEEIRQKISLELGKAYEYATLLQRDSEDKSPYENRLLKVIARVWLDLDQKQRELYIKTANEALYNKLSETSGKYIKWLAGRGEISLTEKLTWGDFLKDGIEAGLKESCHRRMYNTLKEEWLSIDRNRKEVFREKNPDLFNIFTHYSDEEIETDILPFFDQSSGKFSTFWTVNGKTAKKFVKEIIPVCLDDVQTVLDHSINKYVLTKLDTQIRSWGSLIEKIVSEKSLGKISRMSESIQTTEGFANYFTGLALPEMDKIIFDGKTLNGLENKNIQLFINKDNRFQTKVKAGASGEFQTGAEVLGSSLSAQYHRFLGLKEFENKEVDSSEYAQTVFAQINKMLAMIGFKKMDKTVVPSLHRNFSGPAQELDVYKYECDVEKLELQNQKRQRYLVTKNPDDFIDWREDCNGSTDQKESLFLVPDQLAIQNIFSPADSAAPQKASVRSQAEMIRGAALMIKYFQDWKETPDDFDLGMGKKVYEDIVVFPKHAFINLTVGLVTAPIRGIKKADFPIRLYNSFDEEITDWKQKGLKCELAQNDPTCNPNDPKRLAIQAVITDLSADKAGKGVVASQVVKTADLARFILAIDEFLKATEGIEKTKASAINPPLKRVKENLNLILNGRRQLKMMMFGMSNFLTAHMQAADGGFWSQYSLETKQIVDNDKPKKLEDQVLAIQALLRVYDQWGSGGARLAAIQSYYFMNQELWDNERGFYSASVKSESNKVAPVLYLETLLTLKEISKHLLQDKDLIGKSPYQESGKQAKELFEYYSKEFLNWNQTALPLAIN